MTDVDVVILTWNDGELLAQAIASVLASSGANPRTIVVDNGSSPPAEVPVGVTLLRNEQNRGVAPARNQGVGAGDAPYVCLLDSDAVLSSNALELMARKLDADADVGLVAPVFAGQLPSAGAGPNYTVFRKVLRALNVSSHYDRGAAFADGERDVDFAIGACQVFRRSAFDAVDGLDESYFYGPEDVDFCLRLRESGWRIVQLENAVVEHPPRRRNKRLLTKRGLQHGWAVARHCWRHRHFRARVRSSG